MTTNVNSSKSSPPQDSCPVSGQGRACCDESLLHDENLMRVRVFPFSNFAYEFHLRRVVARWSLSKAKCWWAVFEFKSRLKITKKIKHPLRTYAPRWDFLAINLGEQSMLMTPPRCLFRELDDKFKGWQLLLPVIKFRKIPTHPPLISSYS